MDKILVIDGNWYLHRVFFTMRTNRPLEEALPYAFVGLIMKDACALKATHILVAFDGPNVFRHVIYPEYKATRGEKGGSAPEDGDDGGRPIYSYLPDVRNYLKLAGLVYIQNKKHEADDVLASCGAQYGQLENTKVWLGSQDKDGYQSLRTNVKQYNSIPDPSVVIDELYAKKSKGVEIRHMVMYQTLIGDAIDNIPQLLSPAKAKKAINTHGSFAKWFANGTADEKVWLRANQTKLALNKKLVEMVTDLQLPEVQELVVPKQKLEGMPKAWYAYQDFKYPKSKGLFRRTK